MNPNAVSDKAGGTFNQYITEMEKEVSRLLFQMK